MLLFILIMNYAKLGLLYHLYPLMLVDNILSYCQACLSAQPSMLERVAKQICSALLFGLFRSVLLCTLLGDACPAIIPVHVIKAGSCSLNALSLLPSNACPVPDPLLFVGPPESPLPQMLISHRLLLVCRFISILPYIPGLPPS